MLAEDEQELISCGADPNVLDDVDCTPLMHAVSIDEELSALSLLECNADPNGVDSLGGTALHCKCSPGMVALLVRYGANVRAQDNNGDTPLHMALRRRHVRYG